MMTEETLSFIIIINNLFRQHSLIHASPCGKYSASYFIIMQFSSMCRTEKADSSQKELAVRAAAASIYSTCNFLSSKENVSCF